MAGPLQRTAQAIFAPLAHNYQRWSSVLSLGQDPRWREEMVGRLVLSDQARVLDVAAGTGLITRRVKSRGREVISVDQSLGMLQLAKVRGATVVLATAEALPFPDASFDALTFSYLLRYLDDIESGMRELVRVLRPGGTMGMVEFGRPRGVWGPPWVLYTRVALPAAGALIGREWREVGSFLGPSIDALHRRFPAEGLADLWRKAGLTEVRVARRSLGGGLIMWGRKP